MHDGHVHLRLCAYLPRTAVPLAEFLSSGNLAPKLPRSSARRARVRVAHIEFSLDVARGDGALLDDAGRCRARSDKLKDRLLPTF